MIKKATPNDKDPIIQVLSCDEGMNSPMISQIERYGFEIAFQEIWMVGDNTSSLKATIMRHFNNMYLHLIEEDADYEEIASFSSFITIDKIWGNLKSLNRLKPFLKDYTLEPSKHMVLRDTSALLQLNEAVLAGLGDTHELAQMIFKDEDFKRFYFSEAEIEMGMRRRMEMGECHYMIIRQNYEIVAQAYTTIETNNYITIGGVITKEGYRGNGFGSKVVSSLCQLIIKQGKLPNLFYRKEEAGNVYRKLGFIEAGDYGMLYKE